MTLVNPQKIQMSSMTASLKVLIQGTGTLFCPQATSGGVSASVTIAHNAGTDRLLWQVGGSIYDNSIGNTVVPGLITPFSTPDGRIQAVATVDATNLYLTLTNSTAGAPEGPTTWTYYYRILVP